MTVNTRSRVRAYAWAIGISLFVSLGVAIPVYVRLPAPGSRLGDAVGIGLDRPFRGYCGWFSTPTAVGILPTGRTVCSWGRPGSRTRLQELDELSYDAWSRRVRRAQRSWRSLDAIRWHQELVNRPGDAGGSQS